MKRPAERWALYQRLPSFVLGFHGCDRAVGEAILRGTRSHLTPSSNDYDWLGHGIYFWESNPQPAFEFAQKVKSTPHLSQGAIKTPFVLGAIIDLGVCLNLMDSAALRLVEEAHSFLVQTFEDGRTLPPNRSGARYLDCAVIQTLHTYRAANQLPQFDSVRGMFLEGKELYGGAGFRKDDHIQLCVTNTNCIRGYFRPIELS